MGSGSIVTGSGMAENCNLDHSFNLNVRRSSGELKKIKSGVTSRGREASLSLASLNDLLCKSKYGA